jgi:hypothetical protein
VATPTLEELAAQLAALERDVAMLRQNTRVAQDAAGDALQVAHLNAGLLNALRETQLEHGADLNEVKDEIAGLRAGFAVQSVMLTAIAAHLGVDIPDEQGEN